MRPPPFLEFGIFGSAVVVGDEDEYSVLLVAEHWDIPDAVRLSQTELIGGVQELVRAELPPDMRVRSIPDPEPHAFVGGAITCGGVLGTLGPAVVTHAGTEGFLTAGHVGYPLGSEVTDAVGKLGTVVATQDPAVAPPSTVVGDVAVIELDTYRVGEAVSPPRISSYGQAGPRMAVAAFGAASTRTTSNVFQFSEWIAVPSMSGLWGKVYSTDEAITVRGDSGGPVLADGTEQVVGVVVGGSKGITTWVQDIQYVLSVSHTQLR